MHENLNYYKAEELYNIKLHGRMDPDSKLIALLSNNQGIEMNITGTELWLDIEADFSFMEPWAAIELNNVLISRFMVNKGKHDICLFRGISSGRTMRVKFYRELQAMTEDPDSRILIKGLWTDGLFMAPPYYDHKLEFIGDSITSGEGTYGAKSDEDWTSYCMSYSKTYANLTCKALNAECRVISQGGWGIYSGWDNDRRHIISKYYEKQCGLAAGEENKKYGSDKDHDFASFIPDAIIVNLGTNDASGFNQPPFIDPDTKEVYKLRKNDDGTYLEEDCESIIQATVDFIKLIRKNNPTSHIVWLYGMLGYDLSLILSDAVKRYINETGDNNIKYLMLPSINKDTVGAREHPGYESHKIAAGILTDYLKSYFLQS
ncbi:MAG: GDSL family lipase [Lachnospiraceae bacterium]|nr:GDSL family lipase [Lachnospiraceae bacterium]